MSTSTCLRDVPFAALSIGQMFLMQGIVHVKKSPTTAVNCINLGHTTVDVRTLVAIG